MLVPYVLSDDWRHLLVNQDMMKFILSRTTTNRKYLRIENILDGENVFALSTRTLHLRRSAYNFMLYVEHSSNDNKHPIMSWLENGNLDAGG